MAEWHVLVVEDDPDGQEVVGRILKHHNIPADIAGTGEEALVLLDHNVYSIAVIDLALPQIDGWRLLDTIRKSPKTMAMPCVAITAFHSAEVATRAIKSGFAAYFSKPLDSTSFVRELQRLAAVTE